MIVVDASAMVKALVGGPDADELRLRLLSTEERLHAPFLIDLEVAQSVRRMTHRHEISDARAVAALDDYRHMAITRSEHLPFLGRIWEVRRNLTPYDAAYVALAEVLGAPLLTTDARIAHAPGHAARVELV